MNIDDVFIAPKLSSENKKYSSETINIFYHMFCISDAIQRFNRTYRKILLSGLINHIDNIYINCVGSNKINFSNQLSQINNDKIKVTIGHFDGGEAETLNLLRNFCIENPEGKSLYLHSKGCWRNHRRRRRRGEKKQAVQDWIDCMEYFLIEKYSDCLQYLKQYDTCGILVGRPPRNRKASGYRGNFWWTNNSYVRLLAPCSYETRHHSEWRFLNPLNSKYKELYTYHGSLYGTLHHRSQYTNSRSLV